MKKDKEVKKDGYKDEMFNCKQCNYSIKKEITLKKHIVNNHEDHQCKECKETFSNFMHLLKHVSTHHSQDKEEVHKIKLKEDKEQCKEKHEEVNEEVTEDKIHVKMHMEENKETKKGTVFVFGKSLSNKFLQDRRERPLRIC